MAIRGSDGSITLVTSIDDSGIKTGLKNLKNDFGSVTSSVMKITKTIGALGVAGAAAFGTIVKSATQSFAEYEQLVGGVDTLFKESSQKVQAYAADAYKTAGMSANEYMSTVTSFSASLLQSLGQDTQKAAEFADMAIIDMADNANKMGTDMQRIQDAYQGFAKQNYTMLDNLKLGYGGTKTEMERLIADANKLKKANGEMANLSINSFADVVEAIHTVQTEMGITGTTAKEASDTIQGSVASMKASYKNLLTGIADENADLDKLMTEFGDSVVTVFENITPVVERSLKSLPTVITKLGTMLAKSAPGMIGNMLPGIIQGGFTILETLVQTINANGYKIGQAGAELAIMFVQGVISITPQLFEAGAEVLDGFVDGLASQYPVLTSTVTMITGIFAGLKLTAFIKPVVKDVTNLGISFVSLVKPIDDATKKQLLFNAAQKANVIGIVVTAIAALVGVVYGAAKAYDAYLEKNSEAVRETKAMAQEAENTKNEVKQLADEVDDFFKSANERVQDIEAEAFAAQTLSDELFALAGQTDLTAESKERMKTIVGQLNDIIPDLNLSLDEETGQLNLTKEAVDGLIQKKLELARVEAVNDIAVEALKNQYKLQAKVMDATAKRAEVQAELNNLLSQGVEKTVTVQGQEFKFVDYTAEQQARIDNLKGAIADYDSQINMANESLATSQTRLENLSEVAGVQLPSAFTESANAVEQNKGVIEGWSESSNTALQKITTAFEDFKFVGNIDLNDLETTFKDNLANLPEEAQTTVQEINDAFLQFNSGKIDVKEFTAKFEAALKKLPSASKKAINEVAKDFESLSPSAQEAVAGVIAGFNAMSSGLIGPEKFVENLKTNFANLPTEAQSSVTAIITAFEQLNSGEISAEDFAATIAAAFAALPVEAQTAGGNITSQLALGIDSGKTNVEASTKMVADGAVLKLDVSTEAKKKGEDGGTGYGDGFEAKSSYVYQKAYELAQTALQALQDSQKSSSPSKETKKLGKDFGDGYVVGIDSDKENVEKAATGLATTALNAIQDTQDSHSPAEGSAVLGEDFTDGFAVGIEREGHVVEDAARNMVQGAIKTTQDTFKDLTTGLLDNYDPLANHQRYLDVINEKGMKDSRERLWQNIKLDPKIWTSAMGFKDSAKIQIKTVLTPDMKQVLSKSAVTYKDGELVHQSNLYDIETKRLETVVAREKVIDSLNGKYAEEVEELETAYRIGKITADEYNSQLQKLSDDYRDQRFRNIKHELNMDRITQVQYYDELRKLRDEYYEEGSADWQSITEELYDFDKQMREDALEAHLEQLDYELDQGIISEHDYYREIQRIRDNFFVKDSKEWRDYTKQLNEYRAEAYEEFADEITEKAEELAEKENAAFEKMFSRSSLLEDKYTTRFASDLPLIEQKQTAQGREYYRLNSLRNRNQSLEKQYNLLAELKEREGMDAGLYNYMLSLSREESLQFAQILTRMGDEQFSKYIKEWQEGQNWEQLLSDLYDDTTGLKKLANLEEDKKLIEKYSTAFKELQDRGISESFKAFIENLGVDEALETMSLLLDLSDEDFRAYVNEWESTEKLAQEKSKELYRAEAEQLTGEITSEFYELTKLFTGFGATSAIKFQQGFISKINSIASSITSSLSNVLPGFGKNIKNVIPYSSSILSGSFLPTNKQFTVATDTGSDFIGPTQPVVNNQASSVGVAPQSTTVVLEIDGREFGHAVLEYGGQESRRVGTTIGG